MRPTDLMRLWFTFREPVGRVEYALSGLGLMALKYVVDSLIVYSFTEQLWSPWSYLAPSWGFRSAAVGGPSAQWWAPSILLFWSVPFAWIGVSMTIRRARNAGLPGWVGFFFFVPIVNYVVMLLLCVLPERMRLTPGDISSLPDPEEAHQSLQALLAAAGVGAVLLLVLVVISLHGLGTYGSSLFLGSPFIGGFIVGYLYNRHPRPSASTAAAVSLALVITAGFLLLFAVEGVVCLALASPIAFSTALPAGYLGRSMRATVRLCPR